MKAIIVTGDRHAMPSRFGGVIKARLSTLPADSILIHGSARGVDSIAHDLGRGMALAVIPMPAQWDEHGKGAGPIRNQAMLDVLLRLRGCGYHVEVWAFHDDIQSSKGTKHMATIATRADIPVVIRTSGGAEVAG